MGFIAIDFETACRSRDSACSLGVVRVDERLITEEKHYYIQPPSMDFEYTNIKIHGITPEMVYDKPKFPDVWKNIYELFSKNIVIAHNANFDVSILKALQAEYSISMPNFEYVCSIDISSLVCNGIGGSLKERAKYFGIDISNHHNALDDAKTCANIVLSCMQVDSSDSITALLSKHPELEIRKFNDVSIPKKSNQSKKIAPKYFSKVKPSDITGDSNKVNIRHTLYNKHIVVTGGFKKLTRREIFQEIANVGGILKTGVSRKTDFLIVGEQDNSIVGEDGMSSKEEKAYVLIDQGYDIKIINEEEFYIIMNI